MNKHYTDTYDERERHLPRYCRWTLIWWVRPVTGLPVQFTNTAIRYDTPLELNVD